MRFLTSCLAILLVILSLGSCEATPDYLFLISEETEETNPSLGETASLVEDNTTSLGFSGESEERLPAITQDIETSDTLVTDTPVTDTPATDTPVTDTPATDSPATDTPVTTTEGADDTVPPPDTSSLRLVSLTKQVPRGQTATITVCGVPYTTYRIEVHYATTVSTAKGLEPKTANADGTVTWQWKVGTRTKSGSHRIVIRGSNGESLTLSFITTE